MKKYVLLVLVAAVVLDLGLSSIAWAKAHVPLGRAQICTSGGTVRNVASRSTQRLIGMQGACRLTACVFNDVDDNNNVVRQFIFLSGDDCDPTDDNGDGFCDSTGGPKDIPKRLKAINITQACTAPF